MEDTEWVAMAGGILIGFILAVALTLSSAASDTTEIGNMVCSEKGLGEYVSFDSSTKTIKCEPKPQKEVYDGGWVQVEQPTD